MRLPKNLTGLYKKENHNILFFSITFSYDNHEKCYVLTEKYGKLASDYIKKDYYYTDYDEAYDYAVYKVNCLIDEEYVTDLGDV